jgi:uncharacterized protein YbaP (TraB family)
LSMIHMEMNGFDPEAGVDEVLQKEAQRAGKRVVALESVTDQLEAFLSQDQLSADDVMENATREFDDPDYLDNMLKIWLHGDTDGLEAIIIDELGKFPAVYDALLVRRNSNWIAPLVGMINKGGSYFVVVGAGHLVGEDSVINMLRAKGYTVERF